MYLHAYPQHNNHTGLVLMHEYGKNNVGTSLILISCLLPLQYNVCWYYQQHLLITEIVWNHWQQCVSHHHMPKQNCSPKITKLLTVKNSTCSFYIPKERHQASLQPYLPENSEELSLCNSAWWWWMCWRLRVCSSLKYTIRSMRNVG